MKVTCKNCGAVYEIDVRRNPHGERDPEDAVDCSYCNEELAPKDRSARYTRFVKKLSGPTQSFVKKLAK